MMMMTMTMMSNGVRKKPTKQAPGNEFFDSTFFSAPLLRVALIPGAPEQYTLLMDIRQIVSAGVSNDIISPEVVAPYRGEELETIDLDAAGAFDF